MSEDQVSASSGPAAADQRGRDQVLASSGSSVDERRTAGRDQVLASSGPSVDERRTAGDERGQGQVSASSGRNRHSRVCDDDVVAGTHLMRKDPLKLASVKLVTLLVAVQALVSAVGCDLRSHVDQAMAFAKEKIKSSNPFNLSADEIGAVHLYTQQSPLYSAMNAALRSLLNESIQPFRQYLRLLCQALYKLPQTEVEVFRGMRITLQKLGYKPGEEIVWWQFSSTTRTQSELQSDMYLGTQGERTMCRLLVKSGVNVSEYSAFPYEDEVLLLPGTRLQFDQKLDLGNSLTSITLNERVGVNLMQLSRKHVIPLTLEKGAYRATFSDGTWGFGQADLSATFHIRRKDLDFTLCVSSCKGSIDEFYDEVPIKSLDGPEIIFDASLKEKLGTAKVRLTYSTKVDIGGTLRLISDQSFKFTIQVYYSGTPYKRHDLTFKKLSSG